MLAVRFRLQALSILGPVLARAWRLSHSEPCPGELSRDDSGVTGLLLQLIRRSADSLLKSGLLERSMRI